MQCLTVLYALLCCLYLCKMFEVEGFGCASFVVSQEIRCDMFCFQSKNSVRYLFYLVQEFVVISSFLVKLWAISSFLVKAFGAISSYFSQGITCDIFCIKKLCYIFIFSLDVRFYLKWVWFRLIQYIPAFHQLCILVDFQVSSESSVLVNVFYLSLEMDCFAIVIRVYEAMILCDLVQVGFSQHSYACVLFVYCDTFETFSVEVAMLPCQNTYWEADLYLFEAVF